MNARTIMVQETMEREGHELPVTVTLEYSFEPGEFLESGHPMNGFDRGWWCDNISVKDQLGHDVDVPPVTLDLWCEKYTP